MKTDFVYASDGQPEIKRVLESEYGCKVEKVRTLNMKGKKKMRGGGLIAKPDYKKAYVTLKNPSSFSRDIYPIPFVEEKEEKNKEEVKVKHDPGVRNLTSLTGA